MKMATTALVQKNNFEMQQIMLHQKIAHLSGSVHLVKEKLLFGYKVAAYNKIQK